MKQRTNAMHPGLFVRENVLPAGMAVTEAARLLGVGRPALSNFLNGKAGLSSEMASRLEKAFDADKEKLLNVQRAFDEDNNKSPDLVVSSYVPTFLTIKATDIASWATKLDARAQLSVLLRKLVNSTVQGITHIDFPGHDNSQRQGWDGFLECAHATPWVPSGKSGWEFGCNTNPLKKAEDDYLARTSSVGPKERAEITFVFVTPRNWPGKTSWVEKKAKLGEWKLVKALDASDLEQWLEQSIPAQIWLADQLGMPTSGFATLEHYWETWSYATEPNLTQSVFNAAVQAYRDTFVEWLNKPSEKPLVVAAQSKEEALAFVARMFHDEAITQIPASSTAAVFTSVETMRNLSASAASFIPIVYTSEAERELIKLCKQRHCISIHRHGTVHADVVLDRLSPKEFELALIAMGLDTEQSERLARESGRSLTVLRRRLSRIESVRTPKWASDPSMVSALIPMCLIGTWKENSTSDREVLEVLANKEYTVIESELALLLNEEDTPVWSIESARGVVSKFDVLFAISNFVTGNYINMFLFIAELVLSESDPALELPEDQRWAAGIYGKLRGHSGTLRKAICETLILLSVHGNDLFQERLGIDIQSKISVLIKTLLVPLRIEKLQSHDRDLQYYSEAAPETFLSLIESDLKQPNSAVLELMKPVGSGVFARCWRSSILWALECLAWKPENLARITLVLAKMCERKLEDNWVNKPINSLKAIYRWWMPQTAASLQQRIAGLKLLTKRYPAIGWEICLDQIHLNQSGHSNCKPLWRNEATGAGQPDLTGDNSQFRYEALKVAIEWPHHNEATLGDLIECSQSIPNAEQSLLWDHVDTWAEIANDKDRCKLRERIRRSTFTRRGHKKAMPLDGRARAHAAFLKLTSSNPAIRHAWLFEKDWIEPSYDELEDENFDYESSFRKVDRARYEAMNEIWRKRGLNGVLELIHDVDPVHLVGRYLSQCIKPSALIELLLEAFTTQAITSESKRDALAAGLMHQLDSKVREKIISQAAGRKLEARAIAKLLTLAPFDKATWEIVSKQPSSTQQIFWRTVRPCWGRYDEGELVELIDRLLEVNRPRAAFVACSMDWDKVDGHRLKKLLSAMMSSPESPNEDRVEPRYVAKAFKSLNSRTDSAEEEMSNLEFQFIAVLEDTDYGTPNLERAFSKSPKLFCYTVALATKRRGGGEDPEELIIRDHERRQDVARACSSALAHISRVPGFEPQTEEISSQELNDWLTESRTLLAELGRQPIGDQFIGQLLARHPAKPDEVWPCETICDALERLGSEVIAAGFRIQVFNSRGVHCSSGDGNEERELAQRYRGWAQHLVFDYPFVARILEDIAEEYDRAALREATEGKLRTRLFD